MINEPHEYESATDDDIVAAGHCPHCFREAGEVNPIYTADLDDARHGVLSEGDRYCPINECRWTDA